MPAVIGNFFSWMVVGLPAFLFVITVVVFFHELGHFLMARACGVSVEAFSIGFGRELFGRTDRKGTRWKVSLLPLGGYVKFAGDADVSSRPDEEALRELDSKTREHVLHFKPLHQRALVAVAGPLANFLLAIVILSGLYMTTPQPVEPPVIAEVTAGSAAEAAGLRPGDAILAHLSAGRGMTVHREECANVEDYRKHPEKWLSVTWSPTPERMFGCELRVEVANRMGVLAAVAAAIAGTETNIDHVELQERDTETSVLVFEVKVRDRRHLAHIMRVIRPMPDVLKLSRTLAHRVRE